MHLATLPAETAVLNAATVAHAVAHAQGWIAQRSPALVEALGSQVIENLILMELDAVGISGALSQHARATLATTLFGGGL